jgi:ferric-dicitrate binding protein FerR (iron transport regulator)
LNRAPEAPQTELQAAEWLIRLDADASAETLAEWRQWLEANALNRATYLRLEKGWRETDCLSRLRPLDGSVRLDVFDTFPGLPPAARGPVRARPRWKAPCRMLAGAMLAVLLLGALTLAAVNAAIDR